MNSVRRKNDSRISQVLHSLCFLHGTIIVTWNDAYQRFVLYANDTKYDEQQLQAILFSLKRRTYLQSAVVSIKYHPKINVKSHVSFASYTFPFSSIQEGSRRLVLDLPVGQPC